VAESMTCQPGNYAHDQRDIYAVPKRKDGVRELIWRKWLWW
jgi:hypothetical protein